ncbi:T9SS type A sorting domain-containing protein [Gelatiniphilus marinus]|uniref:T9SS type A sorting domain-containing protein n=1 Tax=Gelatiniphilus marinus TaxID=1759464 RepID=A0ABW5JL64_9FLAO
MKHLFITLCAVCISPFANAQFAGGDNEGSDTSPLHGSRLNGEIASFSVLYQGGFGDGFNADKNQGLLINQPFTIFHGSSGDGFSINMASSTITGSNVNSMYGGKFGDGFSKDNLQSVLNGQDLNVLYVGNSGDGYDAEVLNGTFLKGFIAEIFNGGDGDGFANLLKSDTYLSGLMLMLYQGGNGDGFDADLLTTALTLDVVEHLIEMDVLLYPNPANHLVNIKAGNGIIIKAIDLYDISGKKIEVKLSNKNQLNVSNLPDGIYLINIYSETGAVSKKLIVKK